MPYKDTAYKVVKETKKTQTTGTTVQLIDNRDETFDIGGSAWITFCETHGNYCEHELRKHAEDFLPHPEEWCSVCQEDS